MLPTRRTLLTGITAAALWPRADAEPVAPAFRRQMYDAALAIAKKKIRGGPEAPFFKTPYVDAAFSDNIFLWDTCFIAAYAKYHQDELPIAAALDNFYALQDADGFICREYLPSGRPMWPKHHPVSINPPLLAFAELELYGQSKNRDRLRRVYPKLKANFDYLVRTYRQDGGLFFSDAFGSGMDNIPRYPDGWRDDGQGIAGANLHPEIFKYEGLSPLWNRQGRSVDFTAQMALFADNLATIARLIGRDDEVERYALFHTATGLALNAQCWSEADGFYYDLAYDRQIRRKHIGMFWTLLAGVVPPKRIAPLLAHLTNPNEFWREIPVASYPADQPGFDPKGGYWLGSMWAPTTYMVLRGLRRIGQDGLAARLAAKVYAGVAEVYRASGTFWENYASDAAKPGNQSRSDFCGWTGLIPIAVEREFLL
jgi:glycogen debranching enzyme